MDYYHHLENQGQRPGIYTPPRTVTKRWLIRCFGLRCLVAYIKGNLKYSHSFVAIITWKIKVTTWKKYSTEYCGQMVTGMVTGFTEFGSLHQGQPKVQYFVCRYHHLENQGQRPGKITPPSTVTKRWQLCWLDLQCFEVCRWWSFVGYHHPLENHRQRPWKITSSSSVTKRWYIWWFGLRC